MMDLIVSWLCSAIANAFETATNFISSVFGYDITVFNQTFGFAAIAYEVIRNAALALALILAAWQIINFFTKGAEASTTPIRAALNAVVAVGFIFYGNYLFELILDFCQYPFDTLLTINSVDKSIHINMNVTSFISSAFSGGSMLLYLIMLILICFSFIKLLLEIVERYVVTFVLLYLSPLASSTLASSNTNGIFKKFLTMFISQCILLFLNVWCLKMACSALDLDQYLENGGGALVIPLLLCYAFLRVSAKMDSYINQLGLNAAITGNGLGAEILATGASLTGIGKGGHGAPGEAGSKILGAAKTANAYVKRYDPVAAGANVIKNAAVGANHGFSEAYRSGGGLKNAFSKDGAKAIAAATGKGFVDGAKNSDNAAFNFFRNRHPSSNIKELNDLDAISSNQHLAHAAFSHVQKNPMDVHISEPQEVAAVAKGLGVDKLSKDAAGFIQAGFQPSENGTSNFTYNLTGSGIFAEYDTTDGYRHEMRIHNQSQFDKLNAQSREGYEKFTTDDGHRYYAKITKYKPDGEAAHSNTSQNERSSPNNSSGAES